MAALIKHGLSKNNRNVINSIVSRTFNISQRCYANKHYKQKQTKVEVPACRKLKSVEHSVSSRGFLRCQKSYNPPTDLSQQLEEIFKCTNKQSDASDECMLDPSERYALFNACFEQFKHSIPNSILHTIRTYGDLRHFYEMPVDTTLPLDKMKTVDLPPNLHIQLDPLRFSPQEDTMFNGQTAFPRSNTLVSGLRPRRKYKGHKVIEGWPEQL